MSSITNFALVFYAAHTEGAEQFGAFSVAYVTYSFVLNASRGLSSDPLLVRFSGADLATWRRAVASCTGTSTVVGLGSCVLVLAVAATFNSGLRFALLALGLTLPGLMLQDSWRFSFFAIGRGKQAFLNDMVWAVTLFLTLIILRATKIGNVFWLVFAWGAAAGVAAAVGLLQARVVPRLLGSREWLSEHRDLGYRYLAENTTNSGAQQLRTSGLSIIVGLAAVGYIQAASTLMGPVMVAFMGTGMIGIPEAARIMRGSPKRFSLFCVVVSGGLALVAVAWGAVLLVLLPKGLGTWALGSIWRPTYPLMLPYALSVVGVCIWGGAIAGLHAMGAAERSLRAMIFTSAAGLAGGLVGALSGGVLGAVEGMAVATWYGALLWWWQLHAAMRESGFVPVGERYAERDKESTTEQLLRGAASQPAAGSLMGLALHHEANGFQKDVRRHGLAIKSELAGTIPANHTLLRAGQTPTGRIAEPQPSPSPGLPTTPSGRPPRPVIWTAVVGSDRQHYNRMWLARVLSSSSVVFPAYMNERRFQLIGKQMRIGRRSAAHDFIPEIDLAEPPTDPGISRLHAILLAASYSTWAVLDPGSSNGTLLNGRKIEIGDVVILHDGDRINLGAWTMITVHCELG